MEKVSMDGPGKPHLTKSEVIGYMGIGDRTLDRLIAAGHFPPGGKVGSTLYWKAEDVAAYMWLRIRCGTVDQQKLEGEPVDASFDEKKEELGQTRKKQRKFKRRQSQVAVLSLDAVPTSLDTVKDNLTADCFSACVYFLIKAGVVVYVGAAREGNRRVNQHYTGSGKTEQKDFDGAYFLPLPLEDVFAKERLFIAILDPPLNKSLRLKAEEIAANAAREAMDNGLILRMGT